MARERSKVKAIIDRFEGPWAVIEYAGVTFNFPRSLLPRDISEGAAVKFGVRKDAAETARRRQQIERLEDELFR